VRYGRDNSGEDRYLDTVSAFTAHLDFSTASRAENEIAVLPCNSPEVPIRKHVAVVKKPRTTPRITGLRPQVKPRRSAPCDLEMDFWALPPNLALWSGHAHIPAQLVSKGRASTETSPRVRLPAVRCKRDH
jgi:hypothetical protein